MKHQWFCGGIEPCACTENWKREQKEDKPMTDQPASGAALRALRDKVVQYRKGTQPRKNTLKEHAEVAAIQGALNVVLFDIDEAIAASVPASPPTREGWQPIETAPKDRSVLVYWPDGDSVHIGIAWFGPNMQAWLVTNVGPVAPTHWMPLPPAPAVSPAPQEGE